MQWLASLMGLPLAPALRDPGRWFLVPLFYLALVATAELLAALANPRPGMILHCLLLLAMLWHASWAARAEGRALLVCLAFAPLIRIVSLWLSFPEFPLTYRYLAISLPLFAAVCVARRALGYSWSTLGLNLHGLPRQTAVALTGLLFGPLQYLILRPPPLSWAEAWPPALILLLSSGLLEELIFRGLLLRASVDRLGRWGLWYSSLLFASLQLGQRSPAGFLFALWVGVFFAWLVLRTRSLLGVTLAHGLANAITFLVMPLILGT
ncbi:MAG: CPBP family intramembrane metalloprotease [Anaerolineae bacterium]|nr:CPBP family intramembrane metalloprotease [Anaerolineae bacterium]